MVLCGTLCGGLYIQTTMTDDGHFRWIPSWKTHIEYGGRKQVCFLTRFSILRVWVSQQSPSRWTIIWGRGRGVGWFADGGAPTTDLRRAFYLNFPRHFEVLSVPLWRSSHALSRPFRAVLMTFSCRFDDLSVWLRRLVHVVLKLEV